MTFASKRRKGYVDVVGCIRHCWTFRLCRSLFHSFTHSHTHRITHRTSLYVFLDCLSLTKHCVCNTKQFLCLNFFVLTTGLTDLILNSVHSSRRINVSSDSVVTGLCSRQVRVTILFCTGPTKSPVYWVPRALSRGIKRPEREVEDHLVPKAPK